MLQVRKVRVGDVKLVPISYPSDPAGGEPGEGVLLKAESHDHGVKRDIARTWLDWVSVHMNLGVANAQPPGKELILALADHPKSNEFIGALDSVPMKGRVDIPEDSFYSFTISGESMSGLAADDIEVRFHGNEAFDFVRALLRWWLYYDEDGQEDLTLESTAHATSGRATTNIGIRNAATPIGPVEVEIPDDGSGLIVS